MSIPVKSISPSDVHSSLSSHILADGFHIIMDLDKSHGSWIYDAVKNREVLDGYTSFATIPIGYNHPKMKNPEFEKRLLSAAMNKIANSDVYTTQMAEFVETFSRTVPEQFRKHLFFISGGALAVENSLKIAFDWKVRKNLAAGKEQKGSQIIHFKEGFHGRSGYTMSLTNTDPKKTYYYPQFKWPRIINPKITFQEGKISDEEIQRVIAVEKQAISEIEAALIANPDDIAALILEPIQGEGGDNHFRPEFLKELRRLADIHEFLLIFDEVQCGFGTSGKWWAFEHFQVYPDLFVFGKKTQICGVASTTRIDDVDNVFKVSSRINSTWGGNISDMVRCQRYIEIIEEDKILQNATEVGDVLLRGFISFEKEFTEVTHARGKGMFLALDLPDTKTRDAALTAFSEHNMLTLASGNRSVRIRPALTMTKKEAEEFIRRMETTFKDMFNEGK